MNEERQYPDPIKQDWHKPTVRQLKFLVKYAQGETKTDAAQRAWPLASPPEQRKLVKTTLAMPVAQEALAKVDILNNAGLGVKDTAKVHKRLLSATKKVNLGGWIEEVPNDEVRMRAVETAYKLQGLLSSNKDSASSVNVQVNNVDPDKLAAVVERLNQISTNLRTKAVPNGEVIDVQSTPQ